MIVESSHKLKDIQAWAVERLRESGIEGAARDVRILLQEASGLDNVSFLASGNSNLASTQIDRFEQMILQRMSGQPVHRILGYREFYGLQFKLGPESLEPRPETELLVDLVLEYCSVGERVTFADIGIGSGAIAVSVLANLPHAHAIGTDLAEGTLKTASLNAMKHGVNERLALQKANCLEGVNGQFDFIVSNPPYIPTGEIKGLQREVKDHDPLAALDGGVDGLDVFRRILGQCGKRLLPGGKLFLETGHGQHRKICEMASQFGWGLVSTHLDLDGLERIVVFRFE